MGGVVAMHLGAVIVVAYGHGRCRHRLNRKSEQCDQEHEPCNEGTHGRGVYGGVFGVCKAVRQRSSAGRGPVDL